MKVVCPGCKAELAVEDGRIPPQGLQIRCPKCFKAIEVGKGGGPASDLEAALGVDLSGPSGEASPEMSDGWGDNEFALPSPTIPDASTVPLPHKAGGKDSVPGGGGADRRERRDPDQAGWENLEALSPSDISMIGTYERVVKQGPVIVDDVWGRKAEDPSPQPETVRVLPPEDRLAPYGPPSEGTPKGKITTQQGPRPGGAEGRGASPPESKKPAAPADSGPFFDLGSLEATGSTPDDGTHSRPLAAEELAQARPDPVAAGRSDSLFGDEGLDFAGSGGQEATSKSSGGVDAPDSIFAYEEQSGAFSVAPQPAPKAEPPVEDGWGFGDLEGGAAGGGLELERETLSRSSPSDKGAARSEAKPGGGRAEAGPSVDDIDFSSLLEEIPGDKPAQNEVFFVDSPSLPAGEFEKPSQAGSFSMEELTFDDLDSLAEQTVGGQEEKASAAGAPPAAEDDLFDLDMGGEVAAPKVTSSAPPAAGASVATGAGPVSDRKGRPTRRKGSWFSTAVVGVVLGLVGFGAWHLGLLDSLIGREPPAPRKVSPRKVEKRVEGARMLATPEEYGNRLATLLKEIDISPEDRVAVEEELLWLLAWDQMLFPRQFKAAGPAGKERPEELLSKLGKAHGGDLFKLKLEAMKLAGEGKWKEGERSFTSYLELKERRMAELIDRGRLSAQTAREDLVLTAWFAMENGRPDPAIELLKESAADKESELYPAYVVARAHAAKARSLKDNVAVLAERNRAIDGLRELLTRHSGHLTSRLLLGELLAAQDGVDEALEQAGQVLDAARKSKDLAFQVQAYRALASYLQRKGDSERLFAVLEEMKTEILSKTVDSADTEDLLLLLCRLYLERDKVGQALGTLELCKESCVSAEYYLLHARAYEQSNLINTAIDRARVGHEKHPRNVELLLLLAQLSRKTRQTNSAVAYLERILSIQPDSTAAALTLARLFLEIKDPANARRVLLDAERYVEDSLELQEMLAQINMAMGDDPGSVSALTKILELKKGEDDAVRTQLARFLVKQGNYQDALAHFEKLDVKGLITSELRTDYARSLKATGRTQDAVDVLKRLFKDNPGDVDTARFLADIYLSKEDYFNARFYLEAARRANSKDPEIHYLLGVCCLKLADGDCAVESFRQAVVLAPAKLEYQEQLSNLLFAEARKLGKSAAAKELQQEARKHLAIIIARYEQKDAPIPEERRNADIYFNHGQLLFEAGHFEKALLDLNKAIYLAKHRVDMLVTFADTLFQMNRYDDAVKYYQELLDSEVEKAHAHFYLGKIGLVREDREMAKNHFMNCIELDPKGYPDAHRHLGDIFREKGLDKKARDHYRAFLKLVPVGSLAADEVNSILRIL